ncbi:MAG TPA: hypothetical protein VFW23_09570 [Tepidisphaeraceae bacterium]|nr:hypothetical protein [Tepidisphaeraceae bacterium]
MPDQNPMLEYARERRLRWPIIFAILTVVVALAVWFIIRVWLPWANAVRE